MLVKVQKYFTNIGRLLASCLSGHYISKVPTFENSERLNLRLELDPSNETAPIIYTRRALLGFRTSNCYIQHNRNRRNSIRPQKISCFEGWGKSASRIECLFPISVLTLLQDIYKCELTHTSIMFLFVILGIHCLPFSP